MGCCLPPYTPDILQVSRDIRGTAAERRTGESSSGSEGLIAPHPDTSHQVPGGGASGDMQAGCARGPRYKPGSARSRTAISWL